MAFHLVNKQKTEDGPKLRILLIPQSSQVPKSPYLSIKYLMHRPSLPKSMKFNCSLIQTGKLPAVRKTQF